MLYPPVKIISGGQSSEKLNCPLIIIAMKKLTITPEKKKLYRLIFVTALPIVLQNLLDAAVNSADVLMLNYVSQSAISASSLASQFCSIVFMFFFGIGTGISMMTAQYWGKKDVESINKIRAIGMRYAILFSIIAMALCMIFPGLIMKIYTNDQELIDLGVTYLRIVGPGLIFWALCAAYTAILRSVGKVTQGTIIQMTALCSNVVLNALFIFVFKKGIVGVALATTISRVISLVMCLVFSRKSPVKFSFDGMFEHHKLLHKDFLSMALPAMINDLIWSLGFSMYSVIMGHLGNDVVAANSIVSVVRHLSTVLGFGIGNAALIVLGQILGENKIKEAISTSKTLVRLALISGILAGVFVALITPITLRAVQLTDTAKEYLKFMLRINLYYPLGMTMNTLFIGGVFRAGGDSKFGLWADTIDMWAYAVPLGFIAAFVLKLPVKWVYFLLCTDEFVKWPWVFRRYFSMKWAKNITRDEEGNKVSEETAEG